MNTATWVKEKLDQDSRINSVSIDGNTMTIERKFGPAFNAILFSSSNISQSQVIKLLENVEEQIDFVCYTPKDACVSGAVYSYLNDKKIAFGSIGDLMRFSGNKTNWPYENPGVGFIMRGLSQHSRVQRVTRLDNKRYLVNRIALPDFVLVECDDYEFSGESVRHTKEVFKEFDMIFASNNFGRMLASSEDISRQLGLKVGRWRDVLIQLSRR